MNLLSFINQLLEKADFNRFELEEILAQRDKELTEGFSLIKILADSIGQTDDDGCVFFTYDMADIAAYLNLDVEVARFVMWCFDAQGKLTKVQGEDRWYLGTVFDC